MLKQTLKYTAIMACIVGLAACGGNSGKSGSAEKAAAGGASADGKKTLVYCSEGSPEGFDRRSTQQVRRLTQPPTRCTTPWHNSNVAKLQLNQDWLRAGMYHRMVKPTPSTCAKA